MVAVRIAHGNTAIGALSGGIIAARVSDRILNVCNLYDSMIPH